MARADPRRTTSENAARSHARDERAKRASRLGGCGNPRRQCKQRTPSISRRNRSPINRPPIPVATITHRSSHCTLARVRVRVTSASDESITPTTPLCQRPLSVGVPDVRQRTRARGPTGSTPRAPAATVRRSGITVCAACTRARSGTATPSASSRRRLERRSRLELRKRRPFHPIDLVGEPVGHVRPRALEAIEQARVREVGRPVVVGARITRPQAWMTVRSADRKYQAHCPPSRWATRESLVLRNGALQMTWNRQRSL